MGLSGPEQGDVVVIRLHEQSESCSSNGLLGCRETRWLSNDGQVFVNGQPLAEPYLLAPRPVFYGRRSSPLCTFCSWVIIVAFPTTRAALGLFPWKMWSVEPGFLTGRLDKLGFYINQKVDGEL